MAARTEGTFRPTAQDRGIAGFEAEAGRIRRHIGAAFIDDADDAERHGDAFDLQAVGSIPGTERAADRIRQLGDFLKAQRHALDPLGIEQQAIEQGARKGRVVAPAFMSRSLAARIFGACTRISAAIALSARSFFSRGAWASLASARLGRTAQRQHLTHQRVAANILLERGHTLCIPKASRVLHQPPRPSSPQAGRRSSERARSKAPRPSGDEGLG